MLGSLAEALAGARKDIVGLDVNGLEARIAVQENLCQQVHALDAQLDQLQQQCATRLQVTDGTEIHATQAESGAGDSHDFAGRLAETRERMKKAQGLVKELNETHRALLRRCRRTTQALLNSYATFAGTYADPWRAGRALLGSPQENSRGRI